MVIMHACTVYWNKGALQRNCRLICFLFSRNLTKRLWGLILWYLWIGRARHPGPPSQPRHLCLEFHNVGGWLTHGDLALAAGVDFLAVAEHRLIPARVRCEWSRLKAKGLPSIWAPASQASSHVGNAGVGVVSLRGAPLALPTFVTAQFKSFFDCGRAVRCLLPLASGRFLHLFVLYGYQGADSDAEQLAWTEQLFDAALGELHAVASGQPCLLVGDFNVEPTKIPCLANGISSGPWVDFEKAWAVAAGLQPAPPVSVVGLRLVVTVENLFLVVHLLLLLFCLARFSQIGGLLLIWLFVLSLIMGSGSLGSLSLFVVHLFGLLLGCLLLIKVGVLSLLRYGGFGKFMTSGFSLCLVGTPLCLMILLIRMMFLWLGLSGLVLLSLHLLMRFSLVVVLFLLEVWYWAGVLLCFVGFSWVLTGFVELVLTLLTLLMLLMSFCIVTFPLLLCLTCGVVLRR